MQINWKMVSGALAAVLIHDTVISSVNRKRFNKMKEKLEREQKRSIYLASRLDESGIRMTEFDQIVANEFKHG